MGMGRREGYVCMYIYPPNHHTRHTPFPTHRLRPAQDHHLVLLPPRPSRGGELLLLLLLSLLLLWSVLLIGGGGYLTCGLF